MSNQDKYKHQQPSRVTSPTVSNVATNSLESPPVALQASDDIPNEVIDIEPEMNQYESLYEAVVLCLCAGGKSALSLAAITNVVEVDWKSLTSEQKKELFTRIERLSAMAQALAATVKEFLIYSVAS